MNSTASLWSMLGRFSSYAAADDASSLTLVDVGARLGPHINNKRRSIADQPRERVLRQEVSWRMTTRNDGGTRARISNRQGRQVLHAPFHVAGGLSPGAGISFWTTKPRIFKANRRCCGARAGLRFGHVGRTSAQMFFSHRAGPAASVKNHAHDCAWSRAIVLETEPVRRSP